jgi:hypothetical protein
MEYLEGRNEEDKSEENNNESDLDDESNASDGGERDSDLQSSNRNEEGKNLFFNQLYLKFEIYGSILGSKFRYREGICCATTKVKTHQPWD